MGARIEVSHAEASDFEQIAGLCVEAREESAFGTQICGTDVERIRRQLSVLDSVPGVQFLAARQGAIVLGFIVMRSLEPHLFADEPSLFIELLYVAKEVRRRGVGHALLAAAADRAQAQGATEVFTVLTPGSRGVQRYLARLGFAPLAGHRWVTTSLLQRRLAGDHRDTRRRSRMVDDVVAARRRMRRDASAGTA